MKLQVTCDFCGKEFSRKSSKVHAHNYCCRACLGKANRQRFLKEPSELKCSCCGTVFTRKRIHKDRKGNYFCSPECYKAFKEKREVVVCDFCHNEFLKKRSDIMRTDHNFCSADCAKKYRILTSECKNRRINGIYSHRYVAEQICGRPLTPSEEVHHIDGDHLNNNPNNLMVVSKSEHSIIHASQKRRKANGQFAKNDENA